MKKELLHNLFVLAYTQGRIDYDKKLSNVELQELENSMIKYVLEKDVK